MKKYARLITVVYRRSTAKDSECFERNMHKKMTGHLIGLLKEGIENGVFKEVNTDIAAFLILGMLEKITLSSLYWEEPTKLEEIVPYVTEFIKNAIVK